MINENEIIICDSKHKVLGYYIKRVHECKNKAVYFYQFELKFHAKCNECFFVNSEWERKHYLQMSKKEYLININTLILK